MTPHEPDDRETLGRDHADTREFPLWHAISREGMALRIPTYVGGHRIISELGRGGFGVVYLAEDSQLERKVAIKVLMPACEEGKKFLDRFDREARSAAKMKHTNIVSVYSTGEQEGLKYLVMEYVKGRTLQSMLRDQALDEKKSLPIIREVTQGLAYAHEHGIIHRDLKPANIMIEDETHRVVIMDFGLARPEEGGITLTSTGVAVGTPAYMSPEQALGSLDRVDRRSDLYSLGVILYEGVTGKLPFSGNTPVEVLRKVIDFEPEAPRKLDKRVNRDIEAIILKAMDKNPEKRYQTAAEFLDDITRCLQDQPVKAKKRTVAGLVAKWMRRNRRLVSSVAITSATLTICIGLFSLRALQHQRERVSQVEELARKARTESELKETQHNEEEQGVWEATPFFEDGFEGDSLSSMWHLEGDTAGWHVGGGNLEYFGQQGGVAWIEQPLTGDFLMKWDVELPEWTEEKLETAARNCMLDRGLPMPPDGVRIAPRRQNWDRSSVMRNGAGLISSVPVGDRMYNLATYLEIELQESLQRVWRVHLGGIGAESPRDPDIPFTMASLTGLVLASGEPWKEEGVLQSKGEAFRCDLGKYSVVLAREKNTVWVQIGEERVLQAEMPTEASIKLGLAAYRLRDWPWPGGALGKGPTTSRTLTWQRFERVRVFRRTLAKFGDPLALAERPLSKGDFQAADQAYRSALKEGLDQETVIRAHTGLAKALAGQNRLDEAIEELKEACQAGLKDVVVKCETINTLRDAGGDPTLKDYFSPEDALEAWKFFLGSGHEDLADSLESQLSVSDVDSLLLYLDDSSGAVRCGAYRALYRLRSEIAIPASRRFKTPEGCEMWPWTESVQLWGETWARDVIHKKTGLALVLVSTGLETITPKSRAGGEEKDEETGTTLPQLKPFYVGKFEVTNEQLDTFLSQTGGSRNDCGKKRGPYHPATCLGWKDANAYCSWAGLNLPAQEEWEYACRTGTKALSYMWDNEKRLGTYAWDELIKDQTVVSAGGGIQNAWGIYDMFGNAWEWCADANGSSPEQDAQSAEHMALGGSSFYDPSGSPTVLRYGFSEQFRHQNLGFRVVLRNP